MDAFSDLAFFSLLMQHGSLAATAQQMGITPPSVSKRLAALEARLGVRLLHRTTRRIALTPEGETYLGEGARVLADLEALERTVAGARSTPRGLLKVGASLGFGRRHVAPALAQLAERHPELELQLLLGERPARLVEDGLDAVIRLGDLPDARFTARLLAPNQRVLCAAPAYLARAGEPATPRELGRHRCLFIREGDEAFGSWQLSAGPTGSRHETVKVRGPLNTNDGETALQWALAGHGVLLRSLWDAAPYLRSGRLRRVLPDWRGPAADISVVFPSKAQMSAKTRALVDFLLAWFEPQRQAATVAEAW